MTNPQDIASKANEALLPSNYSEVLHFLKAHIRSTQVRAVIAANTELIGLYLEIGKKLSQSETASWGKKIVEHLANDLRKEFPDMKGFSRSNIFAMKQVYQAYEDAPNSVQQLVGLIPWGHNILIVTKIKELSVRQWYLEKTIQNGWSRSILSAQIESSLHEREGKAVTNFLTTLPPLQSELAQQTLKDPYIFDFLTISEKAVERDLENALMDNMVRFLLELGAGFAFVGRQKHLEVEGEDFYIDLLFYLIHLRCYLVIDLKREKFKPEHAGKMNFYLAAVDAQMRSRDDSPSIGLILCKEKKHLIVEYAVSEMNRPMGVAQWQISRKLPDSLKGELPSPEELEKVLEGIIKK